MVTDRARGIIEPGSTSVVIPGVPAGATVSVTAYAEDVYGQKSAVTSPATLLTDVEQVALADPVLGTPILTTNTDPNVGDTGAYPYLATSWLRAVENGDFHEPPTSTSSNIDNTTNPLPGWKLVDTSSGGITAKWIADATVGAGGYIQFTKAAHATGTLYLQQDVLCRSSASRNAAVVAIASTKRISSSPPSDNFTSLVVTELDSTKTSLGTYSTTTQDINTASSVADFYYTGAPPALNAATTWLRVQCGFSTSTDSVNVRQSGVYDVEVVIPSPALILPDLSTPANGGILLRNQNRVVAFAGTLSIATVSGNGGLILPNATSPAQTTEGSIVWDSDDDVPTIGDGASRKTFGYEGSSTPAAVGTAANGSGHEMARVNHVHATGAGTPTTSAVGDAAATGAGPAAAMTNHVHGRESFGSTAAAIGTSSGGSATTPSKSDHVHATGAGTPTTAAYGDAAATGTGPAAAMTDHRHGMVSAPSIPSFATPAVVLGTAAAAGVASTVIRSDSTIVAFDATAPTTSALADAAATGSQAVAARRDHVHGRESFGSTAAAIGTSAGGSATTPSKSDHVHATGAGTPAAVSTANSTGTGPAAAMTDHVHAHEPAHVAHDTIWAAAGDIAVATGNDTAAIVAMPSPAANTIYALGATNGDTTVSYKQLVDSSNPSDSAQGDTSAPGSSVLLSHRDHRHQRESFGTSAAAIGTSAGGSATTPSKSDHVHATGAGTPSTQAFGDAAATGSGPAAAMTDHKHAMPANPVRSQSSTTPAAVGTAAVGTGTTDARSDHVHATGAGTPSTQAFGDAAATGSGPAAAMTDHKHAMPSLGTGSTNATAGNDARLPTSGEKTWLTNGLAGNVQFPATQATSADANNLDDYEEGTFTPALAYATVGSSTWSVTTQVGYYTKIGNRVLFHFFFQGVPTNGSGSGNLQLTGLPFTVQNTASSGARFGVEFQGYTKANFTQVTGFTNINTTVATFRASGSAQTTAALAVGDIPSAGTMIVAGAGHYFV